MSAAAEERWLPVADFPGYEVSDLGRVRSQRSRHGFVPARVMRDHPATDGYRAIRFSVGNSRKIQRPVHRVVLEAFVGLRPEGMVARHLNGDPTDNRLVNICWGTPHENNMDTVRHGRNPMANKTHCKRGHPFSGDNLLRRKGGKRACRACELLRRERRRQREQAAREMSRAA